MTEDGAPATARRFDHSLREPMIRELHARPFLRLRAPCRLAYLALKPEQDGSHTAQASRAQLIAFLDRFNAPHPREGAVYHFADLGKMILKWENHSEFATYTLFSYEPSDDDHSGFADDLHAQFCEDWLAAHDGRIISSVAGRIEAMDDRDALETFIDTEVRGWFGSSPSFAAAYVTDRNAAIAADFDMDQNGHIRLVVLATRDIGPGRTGRVAQRFLEVETYRAMSMLTLPVARHILSDLNRIDAALSETVETMDEHSEDAGSTLEDLHQLSADLAVLSSHSSFRFSAARAYEAIVMQRIEVLREERIKGRQLFSEFMKRRYMPAMRTCHSANQQLEDMSARAANAAELLSARVSVTTAEQNRQLLAQMDRRAALQARLQETVEGISVVAISYYAVSLLGYLLAPLTKILPLSKTMLSALLVIPVAALVWISMHRLKERLIRKSDAEKE